MADINQRVPSGSILGGSWVLVKFVTTSDEDVIGLANNVQYNEDFRVQPAEVIGFLGPISYDSLGYQCQITIGLLVPRPNAKDVSGTPIGTILNKYFPRRSQIIQDGKLSEIDIHFYDIADTSDTLNEFVGCVLATNNLNITPNAYAVRNATFFSVEKTR